MVTSLLAPDIDDRPRRAGMRDELDECADDVADITEAATLRPVAVDGQRATDSACVTNRGRTMP